MKLLKKVGTVVVVAAILVLVVLNPVSVYAESLKTEDRESGNRTVYYEIKRGDCLSILAERFGVRISDLTAANNLSTDSILAEGKWLRIPAAGMRYYTVKQGDTLWEIARKFGIAVEVLESANKLSAEDVLHVDKDLLVPAGDRIFSGDEVAETERVDDYHGVPNITVWPVTGLVSSEYGQRWGRRHEGIDIATEESKPIRALESGIVVFAGPRGTYGNTIIINHGHGFRSLYAHASSLEVTPGEYVEQGQTIARVGNTGRSTGPHLHLEILYRGVPLNPEKYLPTDDVRI